ncbi:MAG TPA: hypothetical protein VJ914_16275 [Pseudonocardiaceae bacterium]|nr:hypothetical protein [Pseudonocardiaceae bacterium]
MTGVTVVAPDKPGRIVEIITPGGFETYFRELGELLVEHSADTKYGITYETPD